MAPTSCFQMLMLAYRGFEATKKALVWIYLFCAPFWKIRLGREKLDFFRKVRRDRKWDKICHLSSFWASLSPPIKHKVSKC